MFLFSHEITNNTKKCKGILLPNFVCFVPSCEISFFLLSTRRSFGEDNCFPQTEEFGSGI